MVHESRKRGCTMRHRGPYIDRALIVRVPAQSLDLSDEEAKGYTLPYRFPAVFDVGCHTIADTIRPATIIAHEGDSVTLRVHLPPLP